MPGRRPKPTRLKLLEGTSRVDRERENEPEPPAGEVVMPAFLKYRAVELWEHYKPICEAMGTLTSADPHVLAEWCQLTVKMEEDKTTSTERTARRMLGADLGIGAAGRARLGTKKGGKQDPADKFFKAGA